VIAPAALDAVIAHARDDRPRECCGMLIGSGKNIDDVIRAINLAERPTRFLVNPRDHIDARRAARERGREIVGFYHSHPDSAAVPSPTDIDEAAYPDAVHLIVSLAEGAPVARLFRIAGGTATEVRLRVRTPGEP
jgi:proteasome lid subunit RPN8/RPN11